MDADKKNTHQKLDARQAFRGCLFIAIIAGFFISMIAMAISEMLLHSAVAVMISGAFLFFFGVIICGMAYKGGDKIFHDRKPWDDDYGYL